MKRQRFIPLLVVAAGVLAYCNSFTGPFIFDDVLSIRMNPTIRHLWPIWQTLSPPHVTGGITVEGRPLINLSLAVNYALGGYNVWGYHAFNLIVHILAGLTLLGIVRRTLLQPSLRERFGGAANGLALAVAVLWTVHPLQTESVTYVIQRTESMMGLFYLLTLYCFIRGIEAGRQRPWYGLCVAACALGMACKEVMISAPVMVLLYDRAFVSESFRDAWRRRWPLYLGLASTWVVLGLDMAHGQLPATTSHAERLGISWSQYLAAQPAVILHYLRLSVWPHPLCFDYCGLPVAKIWMSTLPAVVVVAVLLGASVWAWTSKASPLGIGPACGFVGAWFFLILAPSSSVIPLDSPAYEHRMYLPLAAVIVTGVIGIWALAPLRAALAGRRGVAAVTVLAIGLGFLTWRRNQDYRSELAIWQDTVAKRPDNPRAHDSLGAALYHMGQVTEAITQLREALRISPGYAEAHYNLGVALVMLSQTPEAVSHWEQALRLQPTYPEAHNNLGLALWRMGRVGHYQEALKMRPDFAEAHCNLGDALFQQGKATDAISHYEKALQADPDLAEAHHGLGVALQQMGRTQEAIQQLEEALRLNPHYAEAYYALGVIFARVGKTQAAIDNYMQAMQLKPDFAEAHNNLGNLLLQQDKVTEAIAQFEEALRLKPDFVMAQNNLGNALLQSGRAAEAIGHYEQALRGLPESAGMHYNLGVALEQVGRVSDAIAHYEQAVRLKPDFAQAQNRLAQLRAAR